MTAVVTRKLPHRLGASGISIHELKKVVTAFMENFESLKKQLAEVQEAVRELQRKAR